jgi:hypothetical protein
MSKLSDEIQLAIEELNTKLAEGKELNDNDMGVLFLTSLLEDQTE